MRASLICFITFIVFVMNAVAQADELTLQPRIQVNAPHIKLSSDVESWLEANPVIRVGIWGPSHPPIGEGMSRGIYQGIAADYLAVLQDSLRVRFQLEYYAESSDALAALGRHDIQMVAMWNPTRWPSKAARATLPWLIDESVILTRMNESAEPENLRNLTLGVVPDDIGAGPLQNDYPGALLRFYPQFDMAVNAVVFGQVNALWLNRNTASYLLSYHQLAGLKMTPSVSQPDLNLSFGVDRQQPLLHSALDSALQQLPLLSRMRIASGWDLDRRAVQTRNPLGLNAEEERWLHTHQRIDILLDSQQGPISVLNNEGQPEGVLVDVLNTLTQRFGLNFTFKPYRNSHELSALQSADPDALSGNQWALDEENKANTAQLLTSPMVVVMKNTISRPTDFNQLKNERVAIQKGDPLIPWLDTWYPSIQIVEMDTLAAAFEQLNADHVRGVLLPQFIANYQLQLKGREGLCVGISLPAPSVAAVLSASNDAQLPIQIVRKALLALPPADMMKLAAPWYHTTPPSVAAAVVNKDNLLFTLLIGTVLVILCVSAWWIRRLRQALKRGQRSQADLSNQLRFTETLINNVPVALYARDREGKLLRFNQSWSDTVKRPGEPLLGTSILEIDSLSADARHTLQQHYHDVLVKGEPQKWSGPFTFEGETHYLAGWTVPWRDRHSEVGGLIGGWLDMTEQHTLIEHLQHVKDELEQARASKAAFMQSMGHELRTPLNAMIGLLEIELQAVRQPPNENLLLIMESAQNLLSLIGDVFDIFRAQNPALQGTVRNVHLPQLIQSTVSLYQLQAEHKAVKVEVETDVKIERFELDSLLFIRIFSSLLRNAIKYSTGDTITIALFQGRQEPGEKAVPLVVEMANRGSMETDEVFNQDDTSWSETGFNLAACQRMARDLGAELSIESDDEDGVVVSLYFDAVPAQSGLPTMPPAIKGLTIMIVDGYPPGARALQQQLENQGHQILMAQNGVDALEQWAVHRSQLDLIITDCNMPIMDGFTLVSTLRAQEQQAGLSPLTIFGLTAMTSFEATARCLEAGMNECLTKPLSAQGLSTVLQRYFPQQRTIDVKPALPEAMFDPAFNAEMLAVNRADKEQLQQAIAHENRQEAGRMAHRILGGANLIKAQSLASLCQQLESACETHASWDEIHRLADALAHELEKINQSLAGEYDHKKY